MQAALAIFLIISIIACLLSAPIIYLLRRRKTNADVANSEPYRKALSFWQVVPGLAFIILMYFLLAQEHVASSSWLGQRLAAKDGHTRFFVLAAVIWFAIVLLVAALTHRRRRSRPNS